MFDIIGMSEVFIIAVVTLLVIGPERLPETLRTLGLWLGRMRRAFTTVKTEIEKEIGMDEIRRQLHNEAVMDEMKRIEAEVHGTVNDTKAAGQEINQGLQDPPQELAENPENKIDPAPQQGALDAIPEAEAHPAEPAPPAPTPRPRSEAELEAAHAQRAKKAAKD